MNDQATSVGIRGDRVELAFGARFDVRYGKDDRVLRDVELVDRAKNGDLVFLAPESDDTEKVRVRPSTIDSIVGSGVDHTPKPDLERELADQAETDRLVEEFVAEGDTDPDSVAAKVHAAKTSRLDGEPEPVYGSGSVIVARAEGESASDYLGRIERGLGAGSYSRWIGTDAGQRALEDVGREDQARRRDSAKARKEPKLTKAGREKLVDAGADPVAVAAATSVEDVPGVVVEKPKSAGRPYSERNQVWRCGTCKRRTRLPICVGPALAEHEAVAAPAGKRRDDR